MSTNPSYLRTAQDAVVNNFRDWGIPLGRRFRALKGWFHLVDEGVDADAGADPPGPRERALAHGAGGRRAGWERLAPGAAPDRVPAARPCRRRRGAALAEHNLAIASGSTAAGGRT